LSVLSRIYGRAAGLRRTWYDRPHRRRTLRRPVISVGNLVVGGSGKTPAVATLARLLLDLGEQPAILSRGYGRRRSSDRVVVVSDGTNVLEPAARSGDEPQMLARSLPGVPVVVAADRYAAGRVAESRFQCSVHLLDDGFQHLRLARDVDLLVIGRADLEEQVLPSGRLREDLAAGRAADALLVMGGEEDGRIVSSAIGCERVFRMVPRFEPVRAVRAGQALPDVGPGRRAVAVAGIARPQRFMASLRGSGWDVVREVVFRDHHWFSEDDLRGIARAAAETGAAAIVTTEKDAVRIDTDRLQALTQVPLAVLPMRVEVEPAAELRAWLAGRLKAARVRRWNAA